VAYLPPTDKGLYEARREHDACGIGAVARINGEAGHDIIRLANQVLLNLQHRGAAGSDESTGDGAGILFGIPHEFFAPAAARCGAALPHAGRYGLAMVFAPTDRPVRLRCEDLLATACAHHGLELLGWRDVPHDSSVLGQLALDAEPVVRQAFIDGAGRRGDELERALYLARKRTERLAREEIGAAACDFYVPSMSCRTVCYKGMFLAPQLFGYYPDLSDERMASGLAIVHQRYSTNTFPNWRLAQPFRCIAHNGEINSISGNGSRMRARERRLTSEVLGEDLRDLLPVLTPGASDSAMFDNALELLVRAGRTLPHAMMMMVPEAFGTSYHISTDKRAFYEYHAAIMEPWDGPAAMVFTDGRLIGGTLDRNGLRPARYLVTTDGMVVLASEVGVVDVPPEKVRQKGRLQPGRMFLVDTAEGRIVLDNEVKSSVARAKPYRRWLAQNRIELPGLFAPAPQQSRPADELHRMMRAFGYTREELAMVLLPMAANSQEPVGSMGNDAPLAVLSNRPKLLFNYFKQSFAQVTSPPIDPLREGLVMSLMDFTGKRHNLLAESPEHCHQLKLPHPILTNDDMGRLRAANLEDYKIVTIDALFDAGGDSPGESLRRGLSDLIERCKAAVTDGASLLVLSDRGASQARAPVPSLLAVAAVHNALLNDDLRGEAGLVVETGEAREVMHFCLLCGYGANAISPYLAFEVLAALHADGELPTRMLPAQVAENYITAVKKGMLKTMSKMGISTIRSYRSAHLFEAVGIDREVIDGHFTGTSSRIEGVGLDAIAAETLARAASGWTRQPNQAEPVEFGGEYHYRRDGESHLWNPETVTLLQKAVRTGDQAAYDEYARQINVQSRDVYTLRGLFEFGDGQPVPLEEVEPASQIVKRFCTGAMSHGSISKEAHETLAIAMNRIGAASNTGEGGEDPARYVPLPNGDSANCAIKQVASGRFGVTIEYLANSKMLQIKMAQGAKPGEGGQLPGHKVTDEIARMRHCSPGVSLISPPPHHDIYSIEDLAQLIYDLKCSNPGVLVSVKLVAEVGVGTIAAGVAKGGADEVLISGHDGGTGASPLSSIKHAGVPWELGLADTQQTLVMNGLRDRVLVQVDGQMKTGRDVAIGALLGAERFGFGTASLVCLGCVLVRKCHHGTCPCGIATQNPDLRKRFAGQPEHLVRFMTFVAEEVRRIMAQLGFRRFEDMVGRVDLLRTRRAVDHYKARGLDFARVFAAPDTAGGTRAVRCVRSQSDRHADHLDWQIIEKAADAISQGRKQRLEMPIRNVHRTVGTILSNRIVRAHGAKGLKDGTLEVVFHGSAGQSFGAFLAPGVTLRLIGDANDYVGKGLSGGRIVVQAPGGSPFAPEENIIAGNTLLYGATRGELFVNGVAGERFAVRNSGAIAVVEGVGDHGCEYMTGGCVVVLGQTGRNFAAGMSGGIAYVLDEHQLFDTLCNLEMVDLETVYQPTDVALLHDMIQAHYRWTGSEQARRILSRWRDLVGRFVKVFPIDYRKALQRLRDNELPLADYTPATEEVFGG
jgi:glutamate synthase domain-containing protein 2/glutamate synthase domain-containing protein 1/glutamate synthase domain-containing protein 3